MIRAFSGFLRLLALLAVFGAQTAHAQSWTLTDGGARDIGVGADGTAWVIGTNAVPGGSPIYKRTGNTWTNVPGGAERIAVDPQGNAWVVNNSQTIFRHDGTKWVVVPGAARDIGVGANGTVWVIGNAPEAGGYDIQRSTNQGATWTKIPGSAMRISVDPQGNAWIVNKYNSIYRFDGSNWQLVAGAATDIGVGSDGQVWIIGPDNSIQRRENNAWVKKTGGARDISVGANGTVWVVNHGNQIYQTNAGPAPGLAVATAAGAPLPAAAPTAPAPAPAPAPTTLTATTIAVPTPTTTPTGTVTIAPPTVVQIPNPVQNITPPTTTTTTPVVIPTPSIYIAAPGTSGPVTWTRTDGGARDVGVGANGQVWVIGTAAVPGGYQIFKRTGSTWTNVPGGAERIAVDPQGNAWVVNNSNTIFRHTGTQWVVVNGTARDIGIGANGHVWVIGVAAEAGGHVIYRSTDQGANWTKIPGSAMRVSVGPDGNAWVVNNSNSIFRFNGSNWVHMPGSATDVGIGADGAAWVIGADTSIYRFENNNWVNKTGNAAQIAAGPAGSVWVVQKEGAIYQAQAAGAQAVASLPAGTTIQLQGTSIPINVTGGSTTPAPLTVSGGPSPLPFKVGKVGNSYATCGVEGKGLCPKVSALLESNSDLICPTGSFADLGRSACYSCPEGYTRSIHAVDDYKACQKSDSSIVGGYQVATFKAPLCDTGFWDPIRGGECYKCPAGYNRSAAHIDAANACWIPVHEEFSAVTHQKRTIWPHECSSGTFWDGYNGGNCYSCPSGYARTAHPVSSSSACAKWVGEAQARATMIKKAECGPGEIKDMAVEGTQSTAYGGGCWTCPTGTDRTIHPITGKSACEQAPGVLWAGTTRVRGMTCEPHEIWDSVSSGHAGVATALAARNAKPDPITSQSIGGTCWTCPVGYKRTTSTVYGTAACEPPGISWVSAPYNQPGLFGIYGAEEVALALVAERTTINTIISGIRESAEAGTLPANYAQTIWDEIGASPQDSSVLKMAVFARVVAAANEPANATAAEKLLLKNVVEEVRLFRMFMAQDALDAYNAWFDGDGYRDSIHAISQLQATMNVGEVPPDFEEITAGTILGSLATSGAATTAVTLALSNARVYGKLFPHAKRAYWASSSTMKAIAAAKVAAAAAKGAARVAIAMAKLAKTIGTIALSAGPQIIITIGTEVLFAAIEQQIDIANAKPKLLIGVATATNEPPDFARMMATTAGTSQAEGYWSNLMSGAAAQGTTEPPAIPARNPQAFAQHAAAAKLALVAAN